ncbi:hypothetical protein J6590_090997 [Homalodisca vitripennis]|nr:hypothetical protein J6590_090997 [Homalodisca vitripennis]
MSVVTARHQINTLLFIANPKYWVLAAGAGDGEQRCHRGTHREVNLTQVRMKRRATSVFPREEDSDKHACFTCVWWEK